MTATQNQGRARLRPMTLMFIIMIILGVAVLLYPVVATQWNNVRQTEVAREYSALVEKQDPQMLNQRIIDAQNYNAEMARGPILDPWLARISKDNVEYQQYLQQLNTFDVMARVSVPSAEIDLPVYHGTDEAVLQTGVGHLFGTDLPVGGIGTHAVLTAHTGLTTATLFDNLTEVKENDEIFIQVSGQTLKYQVHEILTVLPEETETLAKTDGQDLLTLITCTPYGINTHRLLVHAHRVPFDPAVDDIASNQTHWQLWMIISIAIAILTVVLLLTWLVRYLRKQQHSSAGAAVLALVISATLALFAAPINTPPAQAKVITGTVDNLDVANIDVNRTGRLSIHLVSKNPFDEPKPNQLPSRLDGYRFEAKRLTDFDLSKAEDWERLNNLTVATAQTLPTDYTAEATTNSDGLAVFEQLPVGVYLVVAYPPAHAGEDVLQPQPMLITIPVGNEQGWVYEFDVQAKYKLPDPTTPATTPVVPPTTPVVPVTTPPTPVTTTPAPPQKTISKLSSTGANVLTLFAVASVLIGAAGIILGRQRKKEQ